MPIRLVPVAVAAAAALVVASPLTASAAAPVGAASAPATVVAAASPFTARVAAIQHGLGRITVTGTGKPGAVVHVTGPTLRAGADVAVKADGSWRAVVTANEGTHVITASQGAGARSVTLTAEVMILLPIVMSVDVDPWPRAVTLSGGGAQPGARMIVSVDGEEFGRTAVKADGSWSYHLEGLAFGRHHVKAAMKFDGAINGGADEVIFIDGSSIVATPVVDVVAGTITLRGKAPEGTTIALRDPYGTPIETTSGATSVPVVEGEWSAVVPVPSGSVRLYAIDVVTRSSGADVGSTRTTAVIPISLEATVTKYTTKKVVVEGKGEPGATVSFTDAKGAVVRDSDGAPVTVSLERAGTFTRTIDPRLVDGRTLVLHQVKAGVDLGSARVTF